MLYSTYRPRQVSTSIFLEDEPQGSHRESAESRDSNLNSFPLTLNSFVLNLPSPLLREEPGVEVRGPWENVRVVSQGPDCSRKSTGLGVPRLRSPSGFCNHQPNNILKILTHLF